MPYLNLFNNTSALVLTLLLILSHVFNPSYAQEEEVCIDFNTPYKRIGYGFDPQSYEHAETLAIKNMHHINNLYPESCGGEPVVLCKEESRQDTVQGLNVYRVRIRFACPENEGIIIENQKPKSFEYSYESSLERPSTYIDSPRFITLYKNNCNQMPDYLIDIDIKSISSKWISGSNWISLIQAYGNNTYRHTAKITCPPSPKITVDHDAIGKNKGNPDPRTNWHYEKWWSTDSFDAAKEKCDTKVAEKNLCRFRGGAVDFTYREKRNEQYWVSLRYRCRYD